MGRAGRPTKWTKENREQILLHLENGASFKRAAILSGVSESLFQEWKAQGIQDQENGKSTEFVVFLEQIVKAKEKYIAWLQSKVNQAVEMDGKLALETLGRLRPDEFGKKDKLNIKGNFNVTKFDVELSEEEEAAYKERMKNMFGDEND